ncbi:MAG TPA: hypothetical protein VFQ45_16515, partial [Longimicrobium sp.]|nr:hypothetical protein [Longimicrobium sp.]
MAETIREMIIPGTYIEVRAEGLIGVGGISTGNLGVVGTASRGPVNQVVVLGSYAEALETFGSYDAWPSENQDKALTLVRTLEQLFKGGASTVYAARIAEVGDGSVASMGWTVKVGSNNAFVLTASSPGTWANAVTAAVETSGDPASSATLTLTLGRLKETFTGANAEQLLAAVNEGSRLVRGSGLVTAQKGNVPTTV